MKVKVTLELEVPDGLDDRGSIDLAVEDQLAEIGAMMDLGYNDDAWEEFKINWEATSPS